MNVFVGNPPQASVTPTTLAFTNAVPLGSYDQVVSISNATNSIPLNYSVAAFASSNGSCTGASKWLTASSGNLTVSGGAQSGVEVEVNPGAAGLVPGSYRAEVCVTTTDSKNPHLVIPVNITVIPGPEHQILFQSGLEKGQTNAAAGIATFAIDAPISEDPPVALNLATGLFHPAGQGPPDNIALGSDPNQLAVDWHDEVLGPEGSPFARRVGGAVDTSGNYLVLHSGAVVGPASRFANFNYGGPGNKGVPDVLTNWLGGANGYIGIAFLNSQTNTLNYGYIHLTTASPGGFPAQILEYGFNSTGAAITIP
jgi:hypothetical protein